MRLDDHVAAWHGRSDLAPIADAVGPKSAPATPDDSAWTQAFGADTIVREKEFDIDEFLADNDRDKSDALDDFEVLPDIF
jgi:hypothetical protein